MATFTVTTAADVVDAKDGVLSLREAVAQANATTAADTILFAKSLEGKELVLTGGQIAIRNNLSIDGDRDNDDIGVTLSGGDSQRLFWIEHGSKVALSDLDMTDARAGSEGTYHEKGGAIYVASDGSLTMQNCSISSSGFLRGGAGGAIYAARNSQIVIADSTFSGNGTGGVYGDNGGAIATGANVSLTLRNTELSYNHSGWGLGGALSIKDGSRLSLEGCRLNDNSSGVQYDYDASGGAIASWDSTVFIHDSSLVDNRGHWGGAISLYRSDCLIANSTIAGNSAGQFYYGGRGGGISASGSGVLTIRNSTITGNYVQGGDSNYDPPRGAYGGGIATNSGVTLDIANTIVAGNKLEGTLQVGPDISGTITFSNGHNLFGSDVAGNVSGDRENVAPGLIFAAIDPTTGGGLVSATGIVPLRNAITNPALSGADPLAAPDAGQLGGTGRPLPAGSLPDIGSIEIKQALSTKASANNDVLTGTAKADTINGLAGADFIKGAAGNDTLKGGDGGDVLDGGAGNDRLYGDAGIDLVFYGGSKKVVVDLSLKTDTARRGSETDTLYNVEGAIGSSAADSFKGNEYNNYFQGGLGKDTFAGGSGRDTYDLNAIADSKAGAATRDVITDFDHLVDRIDLMGIDADTTVAGNQAFRWVGKAALTGPGELGFFTSGGNTFIRASNDADAASELEIQLTGIKTLTATDFYL